MLNVIKVVIYVKIQQLFVLLANMDLNLIIKLVFVLQFVNNHSFMIEAELVSHVFPLARVVHTMIHIALVVFLVILLYKIDINVYQLQVKYVINLATLAKILTTFMDVLLAEMECT